MSSCLLFRLTPGEDLYLGMEHFIAQNNVSAAAIMTCVGSLSKAMIRFADQQNITSLEGPFEIVSLVGVLTDDGSHIHASLSDQKEHVVGGHLKPGAIVHTTAEVALMAITDVIVTREYCPLSGYRELVVHADLGVISQSSE